jgi:hypothetical protein
MTLGVVTRQNQIEWQKRDLRDSFQFDSLDAQKE